MPRELTEANALLLDRRLQTWGRNVFYRFKCIILSWVSVFRVERNPMRANAFFNKLCLFFSLVFALTPGLPALASWQCTDGTPCAPHCFAKTSSSLGAPCCCGHIIARCPHCSRRLIEPAASAKPAPALGAQRCVQVVQKRSLAVILLRTVPLQVANYVPSYRIPHAPATIRYLAFPSTSVFSLWRFLRPPPNRAPPSSL